MQEQAKEDIAKIHAQYKAAVGDIVKIAEKDMDELRSYNQPPVVVERVMEAVSLILGFPPTWDSAVQLLNHSTVPLILRIQHCDAAALKPANIAQLRSAYTNNDELHPTIVAGVSKAATSFAWWIQAIAGNSNTINIKARMQVKLKGVMAIADKNAVRPQY